MTRKHFAVIAAIVAVIQCDTERRMTAIRFADWLATENPRFNRERFLAACMVTE